MSSAARSDAAWTSSTAGPGAEVDLGRAAVEAGDAVASTASSAGWCCRCSRGTASGRARTRSGVEVRDTVIWSSPPMVASTARISGSANAALRSAARSRGGRAEPPGRRVLDRDEPGDLLQPPHRLLVHRRGRRPARRTTGRARRPGRRARPWRGWTRSAHRPSQAAEAVGAPSNCRRRRRPGSRASGGLQTDPCPRGAGSAPGRRRSPRSTGSPRRRPDRVRTGPPPGRAAARSRSHQRCRCRRRWCGPEPQGRQRTSGRRTPSSS